MSSITDGNGIEAFDEAARVVRTMDLLRSQDRHERLMDGMFGVDDAYVRTHPKPTVEFDAFEGGRPVGVGVSRDADIGSVEDRRVFDPGPIDPDDMRRYDRIPDRDPGMEVGLLVAHTKETFAVVAAGITDRGPRTVAALTRLDRADRAIGHDPSINTIDRARFLKIDVAMQRQASLLLAHPPTEKRSLLPGGSTRTIARAFDSELVKAMGPERTKEIHDAMHRLPHAELVSLSRGGMTGSAEVDKVMAMTGDSLRTPSRKLDLDTARSLGVERVWTPKDLLANRSSKDIRRSVAPKVERERANALEERLGIAPEGRVEQKSGLARLAAMVGPRTRGPQEGKGAPSIPTRGPEVAQVDAAYASRSDARGR